MTEKRFTETPSTGIVTDNATGKKYNCEMRIDDDLLELLNELHEENTMLKERRHEDINDLSVIAMRFKSLEKENEELKKKLSTEKPILDYFHNRHYYIRDMTTEEIKEWNKTINKVMCE